MRHQRLWTSMFACLLAGELWEGSMARAATNVSGLAKTQWRLVEFQSMDDAQGSSRPEVPSRYVLRLDADGTATLWLNCNRVTGTWVARPAGKAGQPLSGSFGFEHFPDRIKECASPGMEESILRHAPRVRSFLLKQGRLHLSLVADSGVYVWAREGANAAIDPIKAPAKAPVNAPANAPAKAPTNVPANAPAKEPAMAASPAVAAPAAPAAAPAAAPTAARAAEPTASPSAVWQVTRRVNLREAPTTASRVLALLVPGTRMARGACQPAEGREWCRVTVQSGGEGFVAAEYLQPATAARQ